MDKGAIICRSDCCICACSVLTGSWLICTVLIRFVPQQYYFFWPKIKDKTLQIVPHCSIIQRGCYCFILTCHYQLLYNIMAYKQSQYIAAYFSMQELCFTQAIIVPACHSLEVHNKFIPINIQNLDCFVTIQVHQDHFLLRLRWI